MGVTLHTRLILPPSKISVRFNSSKCLLFFVMHLDIVCVYMHTNFNQSILSGKSSMMSQHAVGFSLFSRRGTFAVCGKHFGA
jgi:hypothetical protein